MSPLAAVPPPGESPERRVPAQIGVLGAGTMGSGIAQLAARVAPTLLYDPVAAALERGLAQARDGLERERAKGRLDDERAARAAENLRSAGDLDELAGCELVIEAAPERLELKHEMFAGLSQIVSPTCVLATNTSSLLVTAVASAASNPERVVGMHFFNPAPLMRLLEVVAGARSSEEALELAQTTGELMGKTVIRATDGPGFLVNRCNRPFGSEALRLLQERVADVETIDRIVRMAGSFRMGPFELMDLVGVETGFEISQSFYAQSFGEPRWRPSMIAARQVAAGLYGRKTGHGYYEYREGEPYRPEDPEPPSGESAEGAVVIAGDTALARELAEAAAAAGFEVRPPYAPLSDVLPSLFIDCSLEPSASAQQGAARVVLCAGGSLATLDRDGGAVGFHALPPLRAATLVELVRNESSSPLAAQRAERFFAVLGKHTAWVGDAPGLVLGRMVCQVINESAFALGEGVGTAADIDHGMVLGLSHPRGPLEWADAIGVEHVMAVLDGLWGEYREERYRAAPELRRRLAAARSGGADAGLFRGART